MLFRLIGFCSGSVFIAACSLIYAGDVDDARETSGVLPPEGGGAGNAVDSALPNDADVGPADATVVSDGGFGCGALLPSAKFCADFDQGEIPTNGLEPFYDPGASAAQRVELDTAFSFSPGRSARVKLTNAPSGSYTRLDKVLTGLNGITQLDVRVKLRPESPWTKTFVPFVIYLDDSATPGTACSALLYLFSGAGGATNGSQINMQRNVDDTNDIAQLDGFAPVGEWTEFSASIVRTGPTVGYRASYRWGGNGNGKTVTTVEHPSCTLGSQVRIGLGYHFAGGSSEIRFDDLIADWK